MQPDKDCTFGPFRIDSINECLWQDTRAIPLRPKAFAVLRLLIQHPGLLVTKQQVLDTVWPETFVGDGVLKDAIRQLREALEDHAESPVYIETAHRRGYRFIGKLSPQVFNGERKSIAQGPFWTTGSSITNSPVGRQAELAELQHWLDLALAGERQTVFVTGEPGIGKTTVVEAFLQHASQISDIRVAQGQCLEHYGAAEAYLPVLDGFSRLCRSDGGAGMVSVLRQHAPAWVAQMPFLLPEHEAQLQSAGATRERMLREMADAIEGFTAQAPLLLVLEDLHWSDYSTLDLVSYLARRRDSARLMVIGTYRPVDVIVGDHPLKGVKRELQAHGLCQELPLECLSKDIVKEYLARRFPGHQFPLRLRRTICRRTEGNPLFMVKLVDYLIDEKIIVEEHGFWKVEMGCAEIEQGIPGNLRQLIEKQIERLSPDERMVLEAASVAGMECSAVAIAAGIDMPVERVEKHCDELARRHQFLSPAWLVDLPDGTITPRHRFIHVLYRDVPYRLIPPLRRSQIHHRIAERGIAIFGERDREIAAQLAMHFEQSHDWLRALEYISQAAETAAHKSAHHEAADLARRGLEVLRSVPDTGERTQQEIKLRMILAVSLMATKGFASAEVEEVLTRGRELFWSQGPSPELFHMLWSLHLYYQYSGDLQASLELSEQFLQLAESLNEGALIMEAHRAMGATLVIMGRCTEALKHLGEATALYGTHRNHKQSLFIGRDCKVICGCFAASALWALGHCDQAVQTMAGAVGLAREIGHPQTLVVAGCFAAQLHRLRGEVSLAHDRAKEAVELAEEYGLEFWLAYALINLGWAEAELGNAAGIDQMQRGLAAYEETGARLWSPCFMALLAEQLAKAGRVEQGLAAVANAVTQAERSGDRYSLPELHRIKGELTLQACPGLAAGSNSEAPANNPHSTETSKVLDEAEACFAKSLEIAEQQQAKSWQLRAVMSMDRLKSRQGKSIHAQLAQVYSCFTEGHETADLKLARARLSTASPAQHSFVTA